MLGATAVVLSCDAGLPSVPPQAAMICRSASAPDIVNIACSAPRRRRVASIPPDLWLRFAMHQSVALCTTKVSATSRAPQVFGNGDGGGDSSSAQLNQTPPSAPRMTITHGGGRPA